MTNHPRLGQCSEAALSSERSLCGEPGELYRFTSQEALATRPVAATRGGKA